jgi:hypothetical protein
MIKGRHPCLMLIPEHLVGTRAVWPIRSPAARSLITKTETGVRPSTAETHTLYENVESVKLTGRHHISTWACSPASCRCYFPIPVSTPLFRHSHFPAHLPYTLYRRLCRSVPARPTEIPPPHSSVNGAASQRPSLTATSTSLWPPTCARRPPQHYSCRRRHEAAGAPDN